MTTPAYNGSVIRVIDEAYVKAGLVAQGNSPNSDQYATGLNQLNSLVSLLQTQGLKLWTQIDLAVMLVAGQNLYQFGPGLGINMTKPLRAVYGYYQDSSGIRRPLYPISWQEWTTLSQVSQQGQINSFFVDKQQTQLNVYFWLTPDTTAAAGTAHLVLQTQLTQGVALTDSVSFPVEWFTFLTWALACELAIGQPEAIIVRCEGKKREYQTMLEGWDVEDAQTFFTPDARGAYVGYGFR